MKKESWCIYILDLIKLRNIDVRVGEKKKFVKLFKREKDHRIAQQSAKREEGFGQKYIISETKAFETSEQSSQAPQNHRGP